LKFHFFRKCSYCEKYGDFEKSEILTPKKWEKNQKKTKIQYGKYSSWAGPTDARSSHLHPGVRFYCYGLA
jgi:hypothetical protein